MTFIQQHFNISLTIEDRAQRPGDLIAESSRVATWYSIGRTQGDAIGPVRQSFFGGCEGRNSKHARRIRNRSAPASRQSAGLRIPDGYRFGLHNLRHSLSSWLVNKGKAHHKTVQSLLPTAGSRRRSTFTHKGRRGNTGRSRCIPEGTGNGFGASAMSCGLNCGLDFWSRFH